MLPCTVAVVVMLLPVEITPKPEAIEPADRAPVVVMLPWTAVGRVWLRLGTLLPSVTRTLSAEELVACNAAVPLPNTMPLPVKVVAPVPPLPTLRVQVR
mgnify:CR=1 FL=1